LICSGQDVFNYLSSEATKEDPGESSHWKKYNKNLKFCGDDFDGVYGFGSDAKPYKGIKKFLHHMMQHKYRKMGESFPEFSSIDKISRTLAKKQDRAYSLDVLRQALTVGLLKQHVDFESQLEKLNVCVIGDGFATMTSLVQSYKGVEITFMVNLTKTLMVDLWYLKKHIGEEEFNSSVKVVTDKESLEQVINSRNDNRKLIIALQAKHNNLLEYCPIDLAINVASMQEMHPDIVADYFSHLRKVSEKRAVLFYCCNREEKTLPGGEVVRFMEYPWQENDEITVDELCPWHQQYYVLKPPRYMNYDGPIRHRLVKLN
jgi:putative sugar O-methyltransferase